MDPRVKPGGDARCEGLRAHIWIQTPTWNKPVRRENGHEPWRAEAFDHPVRPVAAVKVPGVAASGLSRAVEGKNLTGQFIARDEEIGRWFKIQDGRVTSARAC
jgi:hypothetical protein